MPLPVCLCAVRKEGGGWRQPCSCITGRHSPPRGCALTHRAWSAPSLSCPVRASTLTETKRAVPNPAGPAQAQQMPSLRAVAAMQAAVQGLPWSQARKPTRHRATCTHSLCAPQSCGSPQSWTTQTTRVEAACRCPPPPPPHSTPPPRAPACDYDFCPPRCSAMQTLPRRAFNTPAAAQLPAQLPALSLCLACKSPRPGFHRTWRRESLRRLGLSHLDLYLVHWPYNGRPQATLDPSL